MTDYACLDRMNKPLKIYLAVNDAVYIDSFTHESHLTVKSSLLLLLTVNAFIS